MPLSNASRGEPALQDGLIQPHNLKPTNFRKPRTGDRPLCVEFRNGMRPCDLPVPKAYTVPQLRWTDTGSGFDVVAVEFAK